MAGESRAGEKDLCVGWLSLKKMEEEECDESKKKTKKKRQEVVEMWRLAADAPTGWGRAWHLIGP